MKNKIVIAFGIPSLSVGGIEKQLLKQLEILDQEIFQIHLITLFDYPSIPNLYDKVPEGVVVHKVQCSWKGDIFALWRVCRTLHAIKPQLVITSMFAANTLFRVLKPFFGYQCIPREHNLYFEKNILQIFLDKILSYQTTKIIAVSKSVALFAAQQAGIPLSKFEIVHNGVEIQKINKYVETYTKEFVREKLHIPQDSIVFLNVGRLKKQKQQRLLIEAFRIIAQKNAHARLYIIGRGPELEVLQQLISQNQLEEQVVLAGYSDAVYDYYRAADAFVLSSKNEGFPNVAIEAMAFGLPLLSTEVPGVDEFLRDGKNGFLAEQTSDSVAQSMERFLETGVAERIELAASAIQTARQFDIEKTVTVYSNIYVQAIR